MNFNPATVYIAYIAQDDLCKQVSK